MTNNNLEVHFSSKSQNWRTPRFLFDKLNSEFHFEIDAAADDKNHLCPVYFSQENSCFNKNWIDYGKSAFMNPEYGRKIGKFIQKAYEESLKGCHVVCLIPSRTDTRYFVKYCMKAKEIRFIAGRLKFVNSSLPSYREDGDFKLSPAPFPSAVVIFDGKVYESPKISSIPNK